MRDKRGGWGGSCRHADRVPAGKGTKAVSTCSRMLMGRANARGSAHLGRKSSSDRRHLRVADVQSGQRSPHSAHRPVDTGKGGLSTEREQGRVRSDSPPGEATGHACGWRIHAHRLARGAPMSHLSMAWGVARGRPLGAALRYLERAMGPLVAPSMSVYGKRSTWTCQASRELCRRSFASVPGRVRALTWLHSDEDVAARVPRWPDA